MFSRQVFLCLLIFPSCSWCSTYAVQPQVVKYIRPSIDAQKPGTLSSYFGYDFALNSNQSIYVGAPHGNQSTQNRSTSSSIEARGDILSCAIDSLFSNQNLTSCTPITPPGVVLGDSYGVTVAESINGDLVACSPTKKSNGTNSTLYTSGQCHITASRGREWMPGLSQRTKCKTTRDVLFILDGSSSVGRDNFELVKVWVKNVAKGFNISDDSTRLGIIQYSDYFKSLPLDEQQYIKTEIPLGKFKSHSSFDEAVSNISLLFYQTYTAHALNKSLIDFMTSDRFASYNNYKVIILLTDGRSNDPEDLNSVLARLNYFKITLFAVGVADANETELLEIAGNSSRLFYASEFLGLADIVSQLETKLNPIALEGTQTSAPYTFCLEQSEIGISADYKKDEVAYFAEAE